jgi:hypothetical protein
MQSREGDNECGNEMRVPWLSNRNGIQGSAQLTALTLWSHSQERWMKAEDERVRK